jgi:hypothetical protein
VVALDHFGGELAILHFDLEGLLCLVDEFAFAGDSEELFVGHAAVFGGKVSVLGHAHRAYSLMEMPRARILR